MSFAVESITLLDTVIVRDMTEHMQGQEAPRGSEADYRTLFERMDEGFCTIEVIFDGKQKPVDYRFLSVNPAFERQTGIKNAVGRRMREITPRHEEHWFQTYGRVAMTGESIRFEHVASSLQRFYQVHAFRIGQPVERKVAVLFNDVTERKKAEAALRDSEDRVRFALETSRIGTWDLDLENHTAFRSLEHDRVFGYTELLPEWTYEMALEHMLPEDRAAVDAKFQEAIRTQGDWSFECRIRRADGEVRWIWAAGRHRRDSAGGMRRMAGIVQDITERKRIQEAVHEGQARLESAIRASNVGPWDWDLRINTVHFSAEWKRQLGYEAQELTDSYEAWESRLHPDDRKRVLSDLRGYRAGERPDYAVEFRMRHKDGSWRWMFTRADMQRDGDGRPVRMLGCHLDITARKQAEEELRLSEEMFSTAFANNPAAIALTRLKDGVVLDVNDTWVAMTGYRREQVLGRSARHMWPSAEDARRFLDELKEKGTLHGWEQAFYRQSGELYVTQISAQILAMRGETLILSTLVDISARKKVEAELQVLNETLERRVEERTTESAAARDAGTRPTSPKASSWPICRTSCAPH